MSSHIHELWRELELPEQYPELNPDQILARVNGALEQEEPPRSTKSPMKRHMKLFTILAAALVLMTGTAFAAAYQLGLLELFFPDGDTSQLEPYVQDAVGSAENEDYRFTVNSALYDGQNIYTVVTVEALNDQAADDLMSNRADAEAHRETWVDAMAEHMLESGASGPDTIRYSFSTGGSLQVRELPHPSEASRSWQITIQLHDYVGVSDTPFLLYAGIMGKDYSVELPLDTVLEAIRLTPNEEVLVENLIGSLKEFSLSPTSYMFETEYSVDWKNDFSSLADEATQQFYLRMVDDSILTLSQLDATDKTWSRDFAGNVVRCTGKFPSALDLTQVTAVIFGGREFPVDGSPSSPADIDSHLYPFEVEYPSYEDSSFIWQNKISFKHLCQGLGAYYTWDENTKTATAVYRGITISATLDSNILTVDGQPIEMTWKNLSAQEDDQDTSFVLPNPATDSGQPDDLLVSILDLKEPWSINYQWNRDYDDQGTLHNYGWIITP